MANTKVTAKVIADGTITATQLASDSITSAKIADDVALGGNPTTTTQSAGNNTTRIATTAFVSTAITNLIDSSPSALNTLNELAAALGDDANFSTTVTNSIAGKVSLSGSGQTISDSGTFTLDVAGDIVLDADGEDIVFKDGGTQFGQIRNNSGLYLISNVQDADIFIRGNDGGSYLNALSFDMSLAGTAVFNHNVGIGQTPTAFNNWRVLELKAGSAGAMVNYENSSSARVAALAYDEGSTQLRIQTMVNAPIRFEPNNALALTLDGSQNATFAGNLDVNGSNFTLGSDSDAEINLRAGVGGTNGAINWTFNSDSTNYASIELPYDTRSSTGLYIHSGYPITLDAATGDIDFQINGSSQALINTNRSYFLRAITQGGHTGSAAGVGVSLGDVNGAELGPGYLTLSRDDTANAKQILFGKNGAVHSYLETTSSGLNIGGANVGIGTNPTHAFHAPTGRISQERWLNSVGAYYISSGTLNRNITIDLNGCGEYYIKVMIVGLWPYSGTGFGTGIIEVTGFGTQNIHHVIRNTFYNNSPTSATVTSSNADLNIAINYGNTYRWNASAKVIYGGDGMSMSVDGTNG